MTGILVHPMIVFSVKLGNILDAILENLLGRGILQHHRQFSAEQLVGRILHQEQDGLEQMHFQALNQVSFFAGGGQPDFAKRHRDGIASGIGFAQDGNVPISDRFGLLVAGLVVDFQAGFDQLLDLCCEHSCTGFVFVLFRTPNVERGFRAHRVHLGREMGFKDDLLLLEVTGEERSQEYLV